MRIILILALSVLVTVLGLRLLWARAEAKAPEVVDRIAGKAGEVVDRVRDAAGSNSTRGSDGTADPSPQAGN